MKSSFKNVFKFLCFIIIGLCIAAAGLYIGETDDAPGAALIGILLMISVVMFGVRTFKNKT